MHISKLLSIRAAGFIEKRTEKVTFKVSFLLSSFLACSALIAITSENEEIVFFRIRFTILGVCLQILSGLNREHQYWVSCFLLECCSDSGKQGWSQFHCQ